MTSHGVAAPGVRRSRLRPPVSTASAIASSTAPGASIRPGDRPSPAGTPSSTAKKAIVTSTPGTSSDRCSEPSSAVADPPASAPVMAPTSSAATMTPLPARVAAAGSGRAVARRAISATSSGSHAE